MHPNLERHSVGSSRNLLGLSAHVRCVFFLFQIYWAVKMTYLFRCQTPTLTNAHPELQVPFLQARKCNEGKSCKTS